MFHNPIISGLYALNHFLTHIALFCFVLWGRLSCVRAVFLLPLVDIVHKYGLKISASPFPTPALSRKLVMQDWDKWHLDLYLPMVYYGFYNKDYSWVGECTAEDVEAVAPAMVMPAVFVNDVIKDKTDPAVILQLARENGASGLAFFGKPDKRFLKALKHFCWK